jgi:hypothetical protein
MASEWSAAERPENGASPQEKDHAEAGTIAGSQPENSPTRSPWWSAPAGRPVAIPAFGRGLLEVLLDLLMPKPVPVPVKVRATTRRR